MDSLRWFAKQCNTRSIHDWPFFKNCLKWCHSGCKFRVPRVVWRAGEHLSLQLVSLKPRTEPQDLRAPDLVKISKNWANLIRFNTCSLIWSKSFYVILPSHRHLMQNLVAPLCYKKKLNFYRCCLWPISCNMKQQMVSNTFKHMEADFFLM